jgi:hypothetical protein
MPAHLQLEAIWALSFFHCFLTIQTITSKTFKNEMKLTVKIQTNISSFKKRKQCSVFEVYKIKKVKLSFNLICQPNNKTKYKYFYATNNLKILYLYQCRNHFKIS